MFYESLQLEQMLFDAMFQSQHCFSICCIIHNVRTYSLENMLPEHWMLEHTLLVHMILKTYVVRTYAVGTYEFGTQVLE